MFETKHRAILAAPLVFSRFFSRPFRPSVLFALLFSVGACVTEADRRREDATEIARFEAADLRAASAMAEVDRLARKGDLIGAIDALEKRATPTIDEGFRAAGAAHVQTAWGQERRDVWKAIAQDRKAQVGPYGEALRSGDAEKLVGALEAQAAIERRALVASRPRADVR